MSSGAPQLSKESSVGKINPDTVLSRQSKLGAVQILANFHSIPDI